VLHRPPFPTHPQTHNCRWSEDMTHRRARLDKERRIILQVSVVQVARTPVLLRHTEAAHTGAGL